MTVYAVTFRVAEQRTSMGTYSERYSSIVAAIQHAGDGRYWDEPTSFVLINSNEQTAAGLASHLDNSSAFDSSADLILVISLSRKDYSILGSYNDQDIIEIMRER